MPALVYCENGIFPRECLNKKGFFEYHHFVVIQCMCVKNSFICKKMEKQE